MDYRDFNPEDHNYWAGLSRFVSKGILVLAILFILAMLILYAFDIQP